MYIQMTGEVSVGGIKASDVNNFRSQVWLGGVTTRDTIFTVTHKA